MFELKRFEKNEGFMTNVVLFPFPFLKKWDKLDPKATDMIVRTSSQVRGPRKALATKLFALFQTKLLQTIYSLLHKPKFEQVRAVFIAS